MKKFSALSRIIAFALVVCLCSAFVPMMTFAEDTGDTNNVSIYKGEDATPDWLTEEGVLNINSAADLRAFANTLIGGNALAGRTVSLNVDIVWNEGTAEEIAANPNSYTWETAGNLAFAGTFLGNGHTISGLYKNNTSQGYHGFFGFVPNDATVTVQDLTLKNCYFNSKNYPAGLIGFVAKATVNINNVTVDGAYLKASAVAGGLIGQAAAGSTIAISDSSFNGTVIEASSKNGAGGLVGVTLGDTVTIQNSTVNASVSGNGGSSWYVGGFVGQGKANITIENSKFTGSVKAPQSAGGLVGYAGKALTIRNSVVEGTVTGSSYHVGGFVGQINGTPACTITNCLNLAAVTGQNAPGGIVGSAYNTSTVVSNCINLGIVKNTTAAFAAGIVGKHGGGSTTTIFNNISATESCGDIFHNDGGEINPEIEAANKILGEDVIRGFYTKDLAKEGLTGWVAAKLGEDRLPLPSAVVTLMGAEIVPDPATGNITVNVKLEGKDIAVGDLVLDVDGVDYEVGIDGIVTIPYENLTADETYTLTLESDNKGITLPESKEVTLTVVDNGEGGYDVTYEEITLNAVYSAKAATGNITVNVKLEGKDIAVGDLVLDVDGVDYEVGIDGIVTIPYENLTADETYTLTLESDNKGITLPESKEVTLTVVDNGEGGYDVTYEEITLNAVYSAKAATGNITVNVKLEGKDIAVGDLILDVDGVDYEVGIDGIVTIPYENLTADETYTLTLESDKGYITVPSESTVVTITVKDNGEGQYVADPVEVVTLNATYTCTITDDAIVNVNVSVADKYLEDNDIIVNLSKGELGEESGDIVNGVISITIPAEDLVIGVNVYNLSYATVDGITLNNAPATVTVTVTDNLDGTATVTVSEVSITGTYKVPYVAGTFVDGYYVVDGVRTDAGLFVHTDGKYYCTEYDGSIIKNQAYYVWKLCSNSELAEGWYYFGEDGAMLNGVQPNPEKDGALYYFENGQPKDRGLFELNGKYYVTEYNGEIQANKSYYVWKVENNDDAALKGWRVFDADGVMEEPKNGIYEAEDGKLYYYVDGQKKDQGGLFQIDGKYYCTEYNGEIQANKSYYVWQTQGGKYDSLKGWRYFDENGVMLEGVQKNPAKDNKLYYFENGKPTDKGLFFNEVDGFYYVTEWNGEIMTGDYYVWKLDPSATEIGKGWKTFGEDGKMYYQNNTVYTINAGNTPAVYDRNNINPDAYSSPLDYNASIEFDGKEYSKAFDFEGVVQTPIFAYNGTGSEMYARTIILFEDTDNESGNLCHVVANQYEDAKLNWLHEVDIAGQHYEVGVFNYGVVEAGDVSELSMYQFFWDANASEEWIDKVGEDGLQIRFINQLSDTAFADLSANDAIALFE